MGKATELDDFLETHRLTPAEIRERRLAEQIGDPDVRVTPDGDFVKQRSAANNAPQLIQKRQTKIWD